jgi:hypothetical protein
MTGNAAPVETATSAFLQSMLSRFHQTALAKAFRGELIAPETRGMPRSKVVAE